MTPNNPEKVSHTDAKSGSPSTAGKRHYENDPAALVSDLKTALEPTADCVHPGAEDEISRDSERMVAHSLLHRQLVAIAHSPSVHGE
jgi:hypothetical protein